MDSNLIQYIYKKSKKRDKTLKYDFIPSLLDIIDRPSHIAGTIIVMSIMLLLVSTMIWAGLSKLDIIAVEQATFCLSVDL